MSGAVRIRRRRRVVNVRLRRTGLVLGWCGLALVAAVLVAGVWTALDALRVRDDLGVVAERLPELEQMVRDGDVEGARAAAEEVREVAEAAAATTDGPHWRVTAHLPGIGDDVAAVRTLTGVAQDIAAHALPRLPEVVEALAPGTLITDGRIDLTTLGEAVPAIVEADDAVLRSREALAAVRQEGLVAPVAQAVRDVDGTLARVATSTTTAARAARLLPAMLGADSSRTYLVLAMNNAEPRALGGLAGSVLVVRVTDGAVELVEQVAGNTVTTDQLPLTETETALFGSQLGRYLVNVTSTPDFPRAAALAARMWEDSTGTAVDGVLALDPPALGALLRSTGPVGTEAGVELTPDTVADLLLNGIYLASDDPAAQDAFFGQAGSAVVQALGGGGDGGADPSVMLTELAASAQEGRVLLWSAHEGEQADLAGTVLSGELAGDVDGRPLVGVYLNDGSGAKIGYYLERTVDVAVLECRPDDSQLLEVTVGLTNTAPDPATLPSYLTGGGVFVPEGVVRTNVLVYAPSRGRVLSVVRDGAPASVLAQQHEGLAVVSTTTDLDPGASTTLTYRVLTASGWNDQPLLRSTPGARPTPISLPSDDTGCTSSQ